MNRRDKELRDLELTNDLREIAKYAMQLVTFVRDDCANITDSEKHRIEAMADDLDRISGKR